MQIFMNEAQCSVDRRIFFYFSEYKHSAMFGQLAIMKQKMNSKWRKDSRMTEERSVMEEDKRLVEVNAVMQQYIGAPMFTCIYQLAL